MSGLGVAMKYCMFFQVNTPFNVLGNNTSIICSKKQKGSFQKMMTIGSILVGGLIGVIATSGFFLNLFVLTVMVTGGFLSNGANVMYLMAFNLMISDTIQLAINLFYQAPTSALQVNC
jgi:hypothetical protein